MDSNPRIRVGMQQQILAWLDQSVLGRDGFNVSFNHEDRLVTISSIDDPEFQFILLNEHGIYSTFEAPSEFLLSGVQQSFGENISEALNRIRTWRDRVTQEVQSPVGSREQGIAARIEGAARRVEDPEGQMPPAEIEDWKKRFEEITAELDRIRSAQDDHERSRMDQGITIEALRRDLDRLLKAAPNLARGIFVRSAAAKILRYVDDKVNLAMTTAITAAVQTVLTQLPAVASDAK